MPITSSAKKALRNSLRKREFNFAAKQTYVNLTKKYKKLISENKFDEAKSIVSLLQKKLDKAAKINLLSKNTVARKKSRLAALLKRSAQAK